MYHHVPLLAFSKSPSPLIIPLCMQFSDLTRLLVAGSVDALVLGGQTGIKTGVRGIIHPLALSSLGG